jgi:hypothetical protein
MNNNDELIEYMNDFVNFDSGVSITDDELKNIGKYYLMYMIGGSAICLNESTNIMFVASEENGIFKLYANFSTNIKNDKTEKMRIATSSSTLYDGKDFNQLWLVWKSFMTAILNHNASIKDTKASLYSESKDTK